ncbi:MAG TPA: permease-like cell division protein FtsX, partial [Verrucomicrobiae bacterium]|nr:permease-like cell division protein FtsX [Verrucomicrobiae bacterium]
STIFILYTFTNIALDIAQNRVGGITAYFNENVTENEINNIKAELELMPNINQVIYISKEQALEKFRQIQELKGRQVVLESLKEFNKNEVILPASLTIVAENLDDYTGIAENLKSERYGIYFEEISDNKKVIERLNGITKSIRSIGVLLVALFVIITVMVMFNTIRLAIYNRREEVEIMRLVGATNWYIRGPFIIEGMIYAILATAITSLCVFLIFYTFSDQIDVFFGVGGLSSTLKRNLLWEIISLNLILSLTLGIVSSSIAMRRYLRI